MQLASGLQGGEKAFHHPRSLGSAACSLAGQQPVVLSPFNKGGN